MNSPRFDNFFQSATDHLPYDQTRRKPNGLTIAGPTHGFAPGRNSSFRWKTNVASGNATRQHFIHECGTKLRCPFRSGGDAVNGQRRIPQRHSHGARFSHHRVCQQPPTQRRHHYLAGGSQRTTVERIFAQRHLCRIQASQYCGDNLTARSQFSWPSRYPTTQRGRAQLSAEEVGLHVQQGQTKLLLQRDRAGLNAESFGVHPEKGYYLHCQESRSGPARLVARIVHFTAEPFFIAVRKIGANAEGIESFQQSISSSKSPGFFRFFLVTLLKKQECWTKSIRLYIIFHENTNLLNILL